jgi:MFS family permease
LRVLERRLRISSGGETFYGWWIVLAGTAVLFVSSGIGFYGHGVILDPLSAQFGWSKGIVSSAVTLYFWISAVVGLPVGRLIDKYGAKPVLITGSATAGFGFILLSRVTELWQLFAVYALMSVGWSGTSIPPVTALISNWFIRRRGFAMGLTMTGLSLGGMVMVPFSTYLTSRWGLGVTLPLLGATFWVVVIPTAVLFVKQHPAAVGQFPDGERPVSLPESGPPRGTSYAAQMQSWTRKQAMGTAAFWGIVAAFLLALGGQISFLMHQVSFLSQTLGRAGAASAVSITAGASVLGRLFLGPVADRAEKRFVAIACFLVQGIAVLALAYSTHVAVLYLGTFAFGLTMGGALMMQSLIIGECFGMVSFGTISGLAGVFSMSGAAFGPAVAGWIYDATQSYTVAFTIFGAASILAIVPVLFAKPPRRSEAPVG